MQNVPEVGTTEGIADVERIDGAAAAPGALPSLLVEVPHGADRRAHYDALRGRLVGDLPPDLELFFHANTDTGAWQIGRRVAERVVQADPTRSALVVRCLIPRTFIDANRLADAPEQLREGGLTAGLAPYVRDARDRALLIDLHARYVAIAEAAYASICGGGGFALSPHTYGPRSMGIAAIDDAIAERLREAYAPGTWESWPLRAEVDLLTRDADDVEHAPAGVADSLVDAYARAGLRAEICSTYRLAPQTQSWRWVTRFPDQTLCLEVRRDLLVRTFDLFAELEPEAELVDRAASPIAEVIDGWLRARRSAMLSGA